MKDKQKQIAISVGKIQSELFSFQVQKEKCVTVTTDDRDCLREGELHSTLGIGEYKSSQNRIVAAYCHYQNELTLFYLFIIIHKLSTTQSKNINKKSIE